MTRQPMSEAQLLASVRAIATLYGYLSYHTHNSKHSPSGFPDLVLVHKTTGALLYRELKSEKGKTTPAQEEWLAALANAGQDTGVWRPSDLRSELIVRQLTAGRPRRRVTA